jgi:hypothetical protein
MYEVLGSIEKSYLYEYEFSILSDNVIIITHVYVGWVMGFGGRYKFAQ